MAGCLSIRGKGGCNNAEGGGGGQQWEGKGGQKHIWTMAEVGRGVSLEERRAEKEEIIRDRLLP